MGGEVETQFHVGGSLLSIPATSIPLPTTSLSIPAKVRILSIYETNY
jgi:hypothetical protein